MSSFNLLAIGALDGRYAHQLTELNHTVSEHALFKFRLQVEIQWLLTLSTLPAFNITLNNQDQQYLLDLITNFNPDETATIKQIEQKTNHDVKALEYYIKQKIQLNEKLHSLLPLVHFAATSEDINNLAYALMHKAALFEILIPVISNIIAQLQQIATNHKALAMLARTHGQAASPTTLGKEVTVFIKRLQNQLNTLTKTTIYGKFNGAVGNFNAHYISYPEINWPNIAQSFVEKLNLTYNSHTTQIEPHDTLAESLHTISRINTILIDLSRDLWSYISIDYFKLQTLKHEIGSSTMPHKVNPIDFENAEGNLGIANALAQHLANKLPISRMQRDLSDSTVLRNLGSVYGHALLAYNSLTKGLSKITPNSTRIQQDLEQHPEVLAEAIQIVLKRYGVADAYEQLKELTRGEKIIASTIKDFIQTLTIPEEAKQRLLELMPHTYIGLSQQLCDHTE